MTIREIIEQKVQEMGWAIEDAVATCAKSYLDTHLDEEVARAIDTNVMYFHDEITESIDSTIDDVVEESVRNCIDDCSFIPSIVEDYTNMSIDSEVEDAVRSKVNDLLEKDIIR